MKREFDYPIWTIKRDRCSKCGKKEFFEERLISKREGVLMCKCKGCGDIHKWSSRITSDDWRIKIIDKILDGHR
jgi:uncharacterized Zn finger protein